jgi:hypothetical protein
MAKSEEWKARRRERRAAARKEREEAIQEYEKWVKGRAGPGPCDNVTCYRCYNKGNYVAKCSKTRKELKGTFQRFRSEILCFEYHKKGHFLNHCPEVRKVKRKPVEPANESTICYHCRMRGHIARNCPKKWKKSKVVEHPAGGVKVIQIDGRVETFCGKCYK